MRRAIRDSSARAQNTHARNARRRTRNLLAAKPKLPAYGGHKDWPERQMGGCPVPDGWKTPLATNTGSPLKVPATTGALRQRKRREATTEARDGAASITRDAEEACHPTADQIESPTRPTAMWQSRKPFRFSSAIIGMVTTAHVGVSLCSATEKIYLKGEADPDVSEAMRQLHGTFVCPTNRLSFVFDDLMGRLRPRNSLTAIQSEFRQV